jgi:hypothetical protein
MIRIIFTQPTDPNQQAAFQQWLAGCVLKQTQLNQAMSDWLNKWLNMPPAATPELARQLAKQKKDEKPKVDAGVYSGQKNYYSATDGMFYGKCAYCETNIYQSSSGDIEHFHPKGNVKDSSTGKTVKVKINNIETEHPGYYWLAYSPQNLLFSCELCNRPNKQRSVGNRTIGKHDYFPLESDFRASQPGEEINELPSLINPLDPNDNPENHPDNPDKHLIVDETGVLASITERGRKTIDLLGLNERGLPNARREKYMEVNRLVIEWYLEKAKRNNESANELFEKINKIKNGTAPYTMIARKAIKDTIEEMTAFTAILDNNGI